MISGTRIRTEPDATASRTSPGIVLGFYQFQPMLSSGNPAHVKDFNG